MSWHGWVNLGHPDNKQIEGAPAGTSCENDFLDVFVRCSDNRLYHKQVSYDSPSQGEWEDLGGTIIESPGVVSWGPGRIDCFAAGGDDHVYHRRWTDGDWSRWENRRSPNDDGIIGAPAAASWGEGRLDVFVRGTDDHMYHKWMKDDRWYPRHDHKGWDDLGGTLACSPTAVSWKAGRIDCFATNTNGHLINKWFQDEVWHDWEEVEDAENFVVRGSPATACLANNRVDVFARGTDNLMHHQYFQVKNDGTGGLAILKKWHVDKSEEIAGSPAAVSCMAGTVDCFATTTASDVKHLWWN